MASAQCAKGFEFVKSQEIAALGIEVAEYVHSQTGALHYHIASDNTENVFLVSFRTVPTDSTGVAHILEHSVLCGSEKYPVRDPFFMMTRRSLNTFMNAMTSSDWTAYPFASQNKKDFFNLMDVYLDATFFSRLDPLDFAQEGHRIEFEKEGDANSDLVYKGVVFNEMKGAMSSPISMLWQAFSSYLFPTSTYHYNSGGEPVNIPDLSYDELMAFYKKHYHPSNAVFMTFGDIPVEELQARMDTQALSRFEKAQEEVSVSDEKPLFAPLRVQESYPLEQDDLSEKTHHVMGWLLGHSTDLEASLEAELLEQVLFDNSGSPLRRALENTDLGTSVSPLCGLESSNRQMSFVCGIEGSEPERADAFEALVLSVLEEVAEKGVDKEALDAQLYQLELDQRELSAGHQPYGLSLLVGAMPTAIHRGDTLSAFDTDSALVRLREKCEQPDFIQNLVKRLLLENNHRVRLTMSPDSELNSRKDAFEKARLASIKAQMSDADKAAVLEKAEALAQRQAATDDPDILPKVTLADVPSDLPLKEYEVLGSKNKITFYPAGTNGLVYQSIWVQIPELEVEQLDILELYGFLLTELGFGELDYTQAQQRQAGIFGSFNAHHSVTATTGDIQTLDANFCVSSSALASKRQDALEHIYNTLNSIRFDEIDRIKEIVTQARTRSESNLTGSGHYYAMVAAVSKMSPMGAYSQRYLGLGKVALLRAMEEKLATEEGQAEVMERLAQLHSKIMASPRQHLVVAEAERKDECINALEALWQPAAQDSVVAFNLPSVREHVKQAWTTSTPVSYCAMAIETVCSDHEDNAALIVLGEFLQNGFLHRAVREQGGAYGAGAMQDSQNAAFRFYSYRDPRLEETLDDFKASITWLLEKDHDNQALEEAILSVVSSLDKPSVPHGEAIADFKQRLTGRDVARRQRHRQRILEVTIDDLKRVANTYLADKPVSVGVLTNDKLASALSSDYEVIKV